MLSNDIEESGSKKRVNIYKVAIFLLLISGASSLMYQVLWSKILLYIFGNSVYSATAVVSSFMLGLGLGSYILGRYSDKIKNKLKFYGILELLTAIFSFLGYFLISNYIDNFYAIFYKDPNESLLLVKFLLASAIVFLPALFMGGTFPVILSLFSKQASIKEITSKLYAINTLGAVFGVILSGFFLLELLGIRQTFIVAMVLNALVGVLAIVFSKKENSAEPSNESIVKSDNEYSNVRPVKNYKFFVLSLFFVSGFISLSYEIIWFRLFSPIIGNFTYSFSFILAVFLSGIALGSYIIKKISIRKPFFVVGAAEFIIGVLAINTLLIINSFDAEAAHSIAPKITLFLLLFFATLLMGIIFPLIYEIFFIGDKKNNIGSKGGLLYAVNTFGSVLGTVLTGLFLLAWLGGGYLIYILAVSNCLIGIMFVFLDKEWIKIKTQKMFVYGGLAFVVLMVFLSTNNTIFDTALISGIKKGIEPNKYFIGHDIEAEVVAYKDSKGLASLKVNGIGMTRLVTDTKIMAHLPMFLHEDAHSLLNIAFGMGTTYRSALKYDLKVDAVELIPSVPEALYVFHSDAEELLSNPNGSIYINDGYNYVSLIKKKYDIITVDPPPPVNSVGTTVLYSEEFYEKSKKIMNEDGIFVQWVYFNMNKEDAFIIMKTFLEAFPSVSIWDSLEGGGIYLLGSFKPLDPKIERFREIYNKEEVFDDINEWVDDTVSIEDIYNLKLDKECFASYLNEYPTITNDKPIIEYYLWRNIFNDKKSSFEDIIQNCR